jgi:hypothetical protein
MGSGRNNALIPEFDPADPDSFVCKATGTIVWAVRLAEDNLGNIWEWADSKPFWSGGRVTGLTVWSAQGHIKAEFGDWVIRGPWGFTALPDEDFTELYEGRDEA